MKGSRKIKNILGKFDILPNSVEFVSKEFDWRDKQYFVKVSQRSTTRPYDGRVISTEDSNKSWLIHEGSRGPDIPSSVIGELVAFLQKEQEKSDSFYINALGDGYPSLVLKIIQGETIPPLRECFQKVMATKLDAMLERLKGDTHSLPQGLSITWPVYWIGDTSKDVVIERDIVRFKYGLRDHVEFYRNLDSIEKNFEKAHHFIQKITEYVENEEREQENS